MKYGTVNLDAFSIIGVKNFTSIENGEEIGDKYTCTYGGKYSKDVVCPDGCVIFRLTAKKLDNENFFKGKFFNQGAL